MALTPGTRLGPYEIVSAIGAGGMGEVYRARDPRLDRDVAIKVLPGECSRDPDRLRRFQNEARAIAALNHPHICQVHDVGPSYLVLEYIEGRAVRGPMPVDDAVRVAVQMASAIEAAHARGILHRDLKPSNVLLTSGGEAKLLDFGLARLTSPALDAEDVTRTVEGTIVGTAAYMSPEQAEGRPLDARSDIFSLGSLLYELISGKRAFPGDTTAQTISAVLRDDPPTIDVHSALDAIVRKCLQKMPARRFQTMSELRAALQQQTESVAAPEASIAVLPFANTSRDAADDYFSDGLTEEIINALTRIPGIKVTARTSAFAFRGKTDDITRIAEALRVRTVLEGSVRNAGNRIRVTAQLINAADGYHLWSDRYDRERTDVFALQDDIAASIAGALQVALHPAAPARRHTPRLPAYEAHLKAWHRMMQNTASALASSCDLFDRAIALDPLYAAPHVGLGECHLRLAVESVRSARDVLPRARDEARKALALEPHDLGAQALVGSIAAVHDYDWPEAERIWLELASRSADSPTAVWLGIFYLAPRRRVSELLELLRRALERDPLNLLFRVILGYWLGLTGEYDAALGEVRSAIEVDDRFWAAHFVTAEIHASAGNDAEALAGAERCYAEAPWQPRALGLLAGTLVRMGDQRRAEQVIRELASRPVGAALGMIIYHQICGSVDDTIEWFERAIDQRDPLVVPHVGYPWTSSLETNPRWAALLRKMNLTSA